MEQILFTPFLCGKAAQRENHTLLRKAAKRNADWGISPPAGSDRRSTAPDLEKAGEILTQRAFAFRGHNNTRTRRTPQMARICAVTLSAGFGEMSRTV